MRQEDNFQRRSSSHSHLHHLRREKGVARGMKEKNAKRMRMYGSNPKVVYHREGSGAEFPLSKCHGFGEC